MTGFTQKLINNIIYSATLRRRIASRRRMQNMSVASRRVAKPSRRRYFTACTQKKSIRKASVFWKGRGQSALGALTPLLRARKLIKCHFLTIFKVPHTIEKTLKITFFFMVFSIVSVLVKRDPKNWVFCKIDEQFDFCKGIQTLKKTCFSTNFDVFLAGITHLIFFKHCSPHRGT